MWVMTERINSRMRQLVSLDPLTGALNRPSLVQQFGREAARIRRRSDAQFAILLIDIDHFRRVNDAAGHAAGDRLLQKTVEILRGMLRDYDLIGRIEGDVFVLLTPGARSDGATNLAKRAQREIDQQASVRAGLANRVSVSIGVAVFGEHGDSWDTMLRAADAALKYAKKLGGNGVELAVAVPPPPGAASGAVAAEAVPDPE
jgi:diguanylate cyclase (GGDEF)-like protein